MRKKVHQEAERPVPKQLWLLGEVEAITGIDDGQGFLKVTMVVIDAEEGENKQEGGRANYSEGVCSKMFKSNSVKQLLILSVAPNVPENWFNLSSMLNLLDMESLEDATGDLKIYNLLVGKCSGQPKFGCPYCDSGKPFDLEPYNLLDLKTIQKFNQDYQNQGNRRIQSHFQNFVNPPILSMDPDKRVIEVLHIPSLHLLLGVVDKLVQE